MFIIRLQGTPDICDGIGICLATIEKLCDGDINFLFTTHFTKVKDVLKINSKIKWAKFKSTVQIDVGGRNKVLVFNHKVTYPDTHENNPDERPDYGFVVTNFFL
jgi:DNA mismatch repair ATPase MutS